MDDDRAATFIRDFGDEAGEALWTASLALMRRAIGRAEEGAWGRWRNAPDVEARRLRRDLAAALRMARLAVRVQAYENAELRRLTAGEDEKAERADSEARSRRQAAGRYAAAVGAVRRRARAEGREPTEDEFPSYVDFLLGVVDK